jgi:hypothetical protein
LAAGRIDPTLAIKGSRGRFIGDVKRTGLIAVFATGKSIASMGEGPIKRYLVTDWTVAGYTRKIIITNVIPNIHFFL